MPDPKAPTLEQVMEVLKGCVTKSDVQHRMAALFSAPTEEGKPMITDDMLRNTVCTKCGRNALENKSKYCGDGSDKDNEHRWEKREPSPPATAAGREGEPTYVELENRLAWVESDREHIGQRNMKLQNEVISKAAELAALREKLAEAERKIKAEIEHCNYRITNEFRPSEWSAEKRAYEWCLSLIAPAATEPKAVAQ